MKQEDFDKGMGPGVEALTASERDDGEAATALIDPVKEAKMMRKFDVSHEMGMKWICSVTKFFFFKVLRDRITRITIHARQS